jgi:hypothetical protein
MARSAAILAVLADADEDARGERDLQFAGPLESVEATLGHLVGCTAVAGEIVTQGFDHHSLRRGDGPQKREFVLVERTGVGVGEKTGFVEYQLRHRVHVVNRAVVAVVAQPLACHLVAQFGTFAEGEESLVAALLGALSGDVQDLLGREIRVLQSSGWLGESAVTAGVAAQHRERDEDLRRIGDTRPEKRGAAIASLGQQFGQGQRRE